MRMMPKAKSPRNRSSPRLLITVTVLGSAGPLRFLVNEEEHVSDVINTALKSYAREGRLPVLGSDLNNFVLYCPNYATEALGPWETIGSFGVRNFMLCKKPEEDQTISSNNNNEQGKGKSYAFSPRPSGGWRAWLNKSLRVKLSTQIA